MATQNANENESLLLNTASSMAVGFLEENALRGKLIEVPCLGVSFNRSDLISHPKASDKE